MTHSLYVTPEDGPRTGLSTEELQAALASKQGVLWVDIRPGDPDARELLQDVFRFHALAVEDCLNHSVEPPKIDDYGEHLFIVAQSVGYHSRSERLDLVEVDLFLGPNFVVTNRMHAVEAVDALFDHACETPALLRRGADFLAHTVLDELVDRILPAVETMDEQIDELEQDILERPERGHLPRVLLLKRNALHLRRSILPQRDLVNRLSRGEYPELIRPEALIFYRDVYDHIVRMEEILDGLRDLADSALSSYLSAENNRMNEVMKALSVVAVIFLPLTLIASIYGTNLDYSSIGLRFEHGFYLMLLVMLVISAGLVLYFRKRGWF